MTLPGETEAGSAGMQPGRGIAWRAHRDDVERGSLPFALFPIHIGSVDPYALKNPRPEGAESLANGGTPQFHFTLNRNKTITSGLIVSLLPQSFGLTLDGMEPPL